MVTLSLGNRKRTFKSIRQAAEVLDLPYMTLYMRLRHGWKPCTAATRKVRVYRKVN
jgi:hypothetical protein